MGQHLTHTDSRVRDLQSELETHEERLRTMRERLINLQLATMQGELIPSSGAHEKGTATVGLQCDEETIANEKEGKLKKIKARCVNEMTSLPETGRKEMLATRESINESQGKGELQTQERETTRKAQQVLTTLQSDRFREEKLRVTELENRLATMQNEFTAMEEQLLEFQGQEELLTEKRQQVLELQNQLEKNELEMNTMKKQLNKFEGQAEQLEEQQQRVIEVQRQLKTTQHELAATREQLNEYVKYEVLSRDERRQSVELQKRLEGNENQMTTMRERINQYEDQGELLREEKQRVTELENQLEVSQHELTTMVEHLNELQRQSEQLREKEQQVAELQNQLETNQCELITAREQFARFQRQGERLREEEQRVIELQSQLETTRQVLAGLEEELIALQHRETEQNRSLVACQCKEARDWVIYRHEVVKNQKLGEGAWGIVFRGKFHGCDVAVKQMHESILSDYNRSLFEREVAIASKCRHPCLLQFIGATADNKRPLLVTEIMECSLRMRLYNDDKPPLSSTEICAISLDVARALNYLHQKREPIIHHDVSSGNVLLWRQGDQWRAKVSDYGTANFVRQSTINYAGAAIYQAPESLNGDPDQPISCKVSTGAVHFEKERDIYPPCISAVVKNEFDKKEPGIECTVSFTQN